MEKKKFKRDLMPCLKCLMRSACRHKTHIICSKLFKVVIKYSSFDPSNRIISPDTKLIIFDLFPNIQNVKPDKDYYDPV